MTNEKSRRQTPLVIAHRGYSSQFPENSMIAFDEGLKAGADGFECDLRMTSDGEIVIFHDDHLNRLCGVSGSVEKSLLSDLKRLSLLQSSQKIPTLEELLIHFHTTRMNLELKPSSRPEIFVEKVLRIIGKVRPTGALLFSSFDRECLRALRSMDPSHQFGGMGILVETKDLEHLPQFQDELQAQTWNLPRQVLDRPWKRAWEKGVIPPLWLWTLDEPHDWQRACESALPVEAIISNRPAALRAYLVGG